LGKNQARNKSTKLFSLQITWFYVDSQRKKKERKLKKIQLKFFQWKVLTKKTPFEQKYIIPITSFGEAMLLK